MQLALCLLLLIVLQLYHLLPPPSPSSPVHLVRHLYASFCAVRWLSGKASTCQCRRLGFNSWVEKISLEKVIAAHSSILVWKIPWPEEPGGLQSTGLQKSWTQLSD